MSRDVFLEDVAPGAPTTPVEVKTLVLYTLSKGSMLFGHLHEALREHDLVNYFELVQALGELRELGHLERVAEGEMDRYRITELGQKTYLELESTLPAAVRDKADRDRELVEKRQRRLAEVETSIAPEDGGFRLTLSLPDAGVALTSFSVFAATREECEALRRRFLNDPAYIYKSVVELLTGRKGVLGEAVPQREELF